MRITKFCKRHRFYLLFAGAVAVAVGLLAVAMQAEADTLGINYELRDNGGCRKAEHTVSAEYRSEQGKRDIRGWVQTNPSGGDCEQDALSFDFYVAQYFPVYGDWDLAFSGGANRTAVGATYGLLDESGMLILRSDGAAAFATNLPAGEAENVSGSIRVSRDFAMDNGMVIRAGAGIDVVPVDWADGTKGRSGKFVVGVDYREWDLDINVNVGNGMFGDIALTWQRDFEDTNFGVLAALEYDFGLDELDAGVPMVQDVQGSQFGLLGAPQSSAISLRFGFTFGI